MVERRDIDFEVEGGDRLRGWLFQPEVDAALHPAISMAHGYAGVKEHGLARISHTIKCIGVANQRKSLCCNTFSLISGDPDADRV